MPTEMINFEEYQTNAEYRNFWDKWYVDSGQPPLSARVSRADLVKATRDLLQDDNDAFARTRLQYLGAEALPVLYEALQDEAFLEPWHELKSRGRSYVAPLEKVLNIIVSVAPDEAATEIKNLLGRVHQELRGPALRALASLGNEASLDSLLAVLRDGSHDERDFVIEGVIVAADAHRACESFCTAMTEDLAALIELNEPPPNIHAPDCLFLLAPERAIELLHQAEIIDADSPYMADAIRACNRFERYPPAELLERLAQRVHPYMGDAADLSTYGRVLLGLAYTDPDRALPLATEALDFGRPEIEASALKALTHLHKVDAPDKLVFELYREGGRERLSMHQRNYLDVYTLIAQAGHSGFYNYFYSTAGDLARNHLSALRAVGAEECARVLKRAMDMLGWFGPAKDQGARRRQLENLSDELASQFTELDARFSAIAAEVERCLRRYVVQYKDDFQSS